MRPRCSSTAVSRRRNKQRAPKQKPSDTQQPEGFCFMSWRTGQLIMFADELLAPTSQFAFECARVRHALAALYLDITIEIACIRS